MKNPIQTLFDEHDIILSAIEIAKQADRLVVQDEIAYEQLIKRLINFFRIYADQYHHHKEEEVLFPEMNKKNELLKDGVIKEMFEHHEDFRSLIKSIEFFLHKNEYSKAQQQLNIYTEALLDHIAVENDEVFQMAETLFDNDELETIYYRFEDCDNEIEALNKVGGQANKTELVNQLKEMQKLVVQL